MKKIISIIVALTLCYLCTHYIRMIKYGEEDINDYKIFPYTEMNTGDSVLNATAIDLAKIGRLYLNKGEWSGRQVIDSTWVTKSFTPSVENDGYQYQWYSFEPRYGEYQPDSISALNLVAKSNYKYYAVEKNKWIKEGNNWYAKVYVDSYALGVGHQILYVCPRKNIIVVRLGNRNDFDSSYTGFIYSIIKDI